VVASRGRRSGYTVKVRGRLAMRFAWPVTVGTEQGRKKPPKCPCGPFACPAASEGRNWPVQAGKPRIFIDLT
jgi:hypothetical protein